MNPKLEMSDPGYHLSSNKAKVLTASGKQVLRIRPNFATYSLEFFSTLPHALEFVFALGGIIIASNEDRLGHIRAQRLSS